MLGRRGGLILEVGALEPYELPVLSRARASEEKALFARAAVDESPVPVSGTVAIEARAGSNARVRAVVGALVDLGASTGLDVALSVGPTFAEPSRLAGGGPFVLGAELGLRWWAPPIVEGWTPYAQAFISSDVRLPGFDPGAGARVGIEHRLTSSVRLEISIGGAVVAFDTAGDDTFVGASGGVRAGVRFGEGQAAEPAP